jgi:hypothetical protein
MDQATNRMKDLGTISQGQASVSDLTMAAGGSGDTVNWTAAVSDVSAATASQIASGAMQVATDLKTGAVDGAQIPGGGRASNLMDLARDVDVTFLSIPDDKVAQLTKFRGVEAYTLPTGMYKGIDYPVKGIAEVRRILQARIPARAVQDILDLEIIQGRVMMEEDQSLDPGALGQVAQRRPGRADRQRHFLAAETFEVSGPEMGDQTFVGRGELERPVLDRSDGGGNAGPDLETIVRGQEIDTLVFMKFKVVDSSLAELPIRTVDTGYGLERFAWLSQGTLSCFHASTAQS